MGLSCTSSECVCTSGAGDGTRFSSTDARAMTDDALTTLYSSRRAVVARLLAVRGDGAVVTTSNALHAVR